MKEYGKFDDKVKEYIITDPHTPVKWTNYIGTLAFGGIIDNTGGGLICKGDPALNRITKYTPQYPAGDFKGETAYIRLHTPEGYSVYSPYYVPVLKKYDTFECHVGLSYQTFVHIANQIKVEIRVFVPDEAPVEIRDYTITNLSEKEINLDLIPVVEYSHFNGLMQYTNADWVPQTMISDAEKDNFEQVILTQYAWMKKESEVNFFSSNAPASSYETVRSSFLGNNEYGGWADPKSLYEEQLNSTLAKRGDNIAALMHPVKGLKPGESRRIITQLGQGHPEKIKTIIEKYRNESAVDKAFIELKKFWEEYLSKFSISTPDESFNTMVNVHNPRQCHTTFNWSRYLSLYQLGLGARGLGFRDSSQDVMGIIIQMPEKGRKLLETLLSIQRPEGAAMHQFFPLSMEANMGDSREDDESTFYGDDHLWSVLAVCAYIKETGNYSFLDKQITFYEEGIEISQRETGTVMEHILRGLAFTKGHTGAHGLPLLGFADWNDTVNLKGKAESLFIANLYGTALREVIDLNRYLKTGLETSLEEDYSEMKNVFEKCAWDGEWFVRYFEENGTPIGSQQNEKGKIYTNGQSWPVISGFAEGEKRNSALDSVYKHLNTKFGIKLSFPGYDKFDPAIGGVTTYPPGAKENGGIFLHTNPWVMIAETINGNGNRAFEYYNKINPACSNDNIEQFECEPYCYPQNILGDEHPQFGLARNSWLSGTSSWTYQAATQYIAGIRASHDGLIIDPCIPEKWKQITINRVFQGSTYIITVNNPNGLSKGVSKVILDGKEIFGNIIPIPEREGKYSVECKLEN